MWGSCADSQAQVLAPLQGAGWVLCGVFRWCRFAQPPAKIWQAFGLLLTPPRVRRSGTARNRQSFDFHDITPDYLRQLMASKASNPCPR
ncbi:hypothetical protein BH20VER1_BH20VER1_07060 [soil metagenome]